MNVVQLTQDYARDKMSGEGTGHDYWHAYRVWKSASKIAEEEKADSLVVSLAALLHDLEDWKFTSNGETGTGLTEKWLEQLKLEIEIINHVLDITKNLSFKGAGVKTPMSTLEGQIVQDADRLDAIGAIGIARAFAYGGSKGRVLYDPGIPPQVHQTFEQYKNSQGTTLNHFHEKLFLLKDLMNTESAKRMAERRHALMQEYLDRFMEEWEGLY